jgi:hypothetical protein
VSEPSTPDEPNGNDIPVPPLCQEPGCVEIGIVGWGQPPIKVCSRHYDDKLRYVGRLMVEMLELWTNP